MRRAALLLTMTVLWLFSRPAHATHRKGRPPAPSHGHSRVARTHVVRRGETLSSIAKRYHVSLKSLLAANHLTRSRPIRSGEKLRILQPAPRKAPRLARHPTRTQHRSRGAYARRPRRSGYLVLRGESGHWSGYAVDRHGTVTDKAVRHVSRVLASWRTGREISINRRLILLLSRVSDHFGGRAIRVVSGYRPYSPTQYTPDSRHNVGKAVDFSIPGVPNRVIFDYCRELHDDGCGYYPNSSFVHMDVRKRSARWIDYAGPGEPPRYGRPPTARHTRSAERRRRASRFRSRGGSRKTRARQAKKSKSSS